MIQTQIEYFFFLTFRPNNVFFVLYKQVVNKDENDKTTNFIGSKVLVSTSCGNVTEKGIKRHNLIAFESNFKFFLEKIKTKHIYLKNLNLILNQTKQKNRRERFRSRFSLKPYFTIMLKHLTQEKVILSIINNQKFAFNGCKLPNLQRKKTRKKEQLTWSKLFHK